MVVWDLYSKRRKREASTGQAEVYRYDNLPQKLRMQIMHILNDVIGDHDNLDAVSERWGEIHNNLARELGLGALAQYGTYRTRFFEWFSTAQTDDAIDAIELAFLIAEILSDDVYERKLDCANVAVPEGIKELNARFQENGVGYQFESRHIVRIDSKFIHAEIVKPALGFLADPKFVKANEDFLTAHEHYRHGKYKDAVVAAQRAFESTLKAICTIKSWKFDAGDRASELLKVIRANGLFPDYLGNGFDSYVAMIRTGLPNLRNNAGGHGEEPTAPPVPAYLAAYALHMTAVNIVFVVDAMNAKGGGKK